MDVFNVVYLHEKRPMNMVDGKKRPMIVFRGSGLRQEKVNSLSRTKKKEGSTFLMVGLTR